MRSKRFFLFVCPIALVFSVLITIYFFGYTAMIVTNEKPPKDRGYKEGDIVRLLDEFDFDHGKWSVYIGVSGSDRGVLRGVSRRNCFFLDDINIIRRMKDDWSFVFTGSDMTTVESTIVFVHDGKVVLSSALVIDEPGEGLQSPTLGWLRPIKRGIIADYFERFHPVYWPLVIL